MITHAYTRSLLRKIEISVGLLSRYVKRTNGAVVLTYHGVAPVESISDPWVQSLHIDPTVLERQLEFVGRHFDIIDVLDLDSIRRASSDRPLAQITFDDGYKNFLTHALPVLERLGVPATVFLTTNFVDNETRLPTYLCRAAIANLDPGSYDLDSIAERMTITDSNRTTVGRTIAEKSKRLPWPKTQMLLTELRSLLTPRDWVEIDERYSTDSPLSWNDVIEISRRGVSVGSHTLDHVPLGRHQSAEDIRSQVEDSRRLIVEKIGECRYFAYPNGTAADICLEAAAAVARSGYDLAYTMIPGVVRSESGQSARYLMPRLGVSADWDGFRKYLSTAWRHNPRYDAFVADFIGGRE